MKSRTKAFFRKFILHLTSYPHFADWDYCAVHLDKETIFSHVHCRICGRKLKIKDSEI